MLPLFIGGLHRVFSARCTAGKFRENLQVGTAYFDN